MHKLRFLGVATALIAASVFALAQVAPTSASTGTNNCTSPGNNCQAIVCSTGGTATTNGDNLGPTTAVACGFGGTRATSNGTGGAVVTSQSTGYANHTIATGNQVPGGAVISAAGSAPNGSEGVAVFTTGGCSQSSGPGGNTEAGSLGDPGDQGLAIAYHSGFNGEASSAAAACGGGVIANTSAYTGIVGGNLAAGGPAGNFACAGQAAGIVYDGFNLGVCAAGVAVP